MHQSFIDTLTHMTYGIYILTTKAGREMNGMVASWVSQVSYEPPLVMVAIRKNRYSHKLILQSGIFALNVVKKGSGMDLSRFKGPRLANKFSGLSVDRKMTGCPIVKDALAYMDCKLKETIGTGDHTLFIGEILDAARLQEGQPMSSQDDSKVYLGAT